ncbi:uncharacterized protein MKK02DRAFT_39205 [Dioszegia hungarica]|uniref:50S ribosomal protein L35 n=1 Tax=Dioszegia hungarica TaxID=4972 RepID=A0AA38LTZ5_9TREE|nr:uncharacterized protein MKK02DRAFT_39205 [Dioszegia hungarica]KAI9633226.1 hypothetical protein MKK02DRAFT_39205 [Dioszegia hungarica]
MFALAARNALAGPSRLPLPLRLPLPAPLAHLAPTSVSLSIPSRTFSASAPAADKLKSHSGTKKRFFRTASGLFKRAQAGKRHLNTLFSASRINRLGKTRYASPTQAKMLQKLLPYA